jgi:hypothetical protein
MMSPLLSVVLPAPDEQEALPVVVPAAPIHYSPGLMGFVGDGGSDHTRSVTAHPILFRLDRYGAALGPLSVDQSPAGRKLP